jgi:hypothetical protein
MTSNEKNTVGFFHSVQHFSQLKFFPLKGVMCHGGLVSKFLSEERKDAVKLLFDAFKHLTTLCTGSIVLLGTFLKDIPDTDRLNYSQLAQLFFCKLQFYFP